jgi:hypothetical protein
MMRMHSTLGRHPTAYESALGASLLLLPAFAGTPGLAHRCLLSNKTHALVAQQESTQPQSELIRFSVVRMSNGQSDDGTFWSQWDLKASTGRALLMQTFPFSSSQRASKEFELYLKGAVKILRRTIEKDQSGRPIGERALVVFPKTSTMGPHYTAFWTRGSRFEHITCESLEEVTALENRLRETNIKVILAEDAR